MLLVCAEDEEMSQFQVKRGTKKEEYCLARCRDCNTVNEVLRMDFRHASSPRCSDCGGMLDKIAGRKGQVKRIPR